MMQLKDYLKNMPIGKTRELVGNEVCNSIIAYNKLQGDNSEIDYPELLLIRYSSKILINTRNAVLHNLLLYNVDNPDIKKAVKDEFLIELEDNTVSIICNKFGYNNIDSSKRFLEKINIDCEKYFPEEEEVKVIDYKLKILPEYKLHDFQKYIKDESLSYLLNPSKSNKQLIHMPTGSGKTKTAVEIVCDYFRSCSVLGGFNKKVLVIWFAHSNELCEQAYTTFVNTWELRGDFGINVHKYYGENDFRDFDESSKYSFVFASLQKFTSLMKRYSEEGLRLKSLFRNNISLVFFDEAHKSIANEWKKSVEFLLGKQGSQLIGLTATPGRNIDLEDIDNMYLSEFFGSTRIRMIDNYARIIEKPITYLQERGFLAYIESKPILFESDIVLNKEEISAISEYGDKRINRILSELSLNPKRNKLLVNEIINEYRNQKSTLVFSCNISHSYALQSILNKEGIKSQTVDGDTPKQLRKKYINDFVNGKLKILINYGVLSTGFDAPILNTLIIARPTSSIVLYSQMVGRALRGPKNGGNRKNKLITIEDNINIGGAQEIFGHFDEIWN